jgi:hypothetical protein
MMLKKMTIAAFALAMMTGGAVAAGECDGFDGTATNKGLTTNWEVVPGSGGVEYDLSNLGSHPTNEKQGGLWLPITTSPVMCAPLNKAGNLAGSEWYMSAGTSTTQTIQVCNPQGKLTEAAASFNIDPSVCPQ